MTARYLLGEHNHREEDQRQQVDIGSEIVAEHVSYASEEFVEYNSHHELVATFIFHSLLIINPAKVSKEFMPFLLFSFLTEHRMRHL